MKDFLHCTVSIYQSIRRLTFVTLLWIRDSVQKWRIFCSHSVAFKQFPGFLFCLVHSTGGTALWTGPLHCIQAELHWHTSGHIQPPTIIRNKKSTVLYMGKKVVKSEFDAGSSMLVELPLVVSTTPKMQRQRRAHLQRVAGHLYWRKQLGTEG